jgi:Ala-tRNA(Pro) deacylase
MPKQEPLGNLFSSKGLLELPFRRVYHLQLPSHPSNAPPSERAQTMPITPADLFAFLDRLEISYQTAHHPPLFTVEQSRSLRGQISGAHTKNLFLTERKRGLYLVVACEDAIVDLKSLHRHLDTARFSFGSADVLREALGVEPGSVTPFAAINDQAQRVKVILDAAMMEHPILNFHPLVNTMTTSVRGEDLVRFLDATGHSPRIEAVSSALTPQ